MIWYVLAAFPAVAGLVAFCIGNATHRKGHKADIRLIAEVARSGKPKNVKAVGKALAATATARGRAPRWWRFEPSVLPWNGTRWRRGGPDHPAR